jgi:predicted nucleic acid-binding protein
VIVVSDTSPLNYLILIGAIQICPSLFDRVIIPETVASELAHERAPEDVRSWIARPPTWLEARAPAASDPTMALDIGERDALSLALELEADLVLVDDKAARTVAKDRGLTVAGTLAVIELASRRGLVDLHDALEALTSTSFRIRKDVMEALVSHARRQNDHRDDEA